MGQSSIVAWLIAVGLAARAGNLMAQTTPAEPAVSGYAAVYLGLTPGEEVVPIGVLGLDHRSWHFLARYGYEDSETLSAWAGRVFEFGDKVSVALTPMVGLVVGQTDAVAPGFEFTLDWGRLTVYNESELVVPFDGASSTFYSWGNTSYRVVDWFQPGVSIQRLRVFESEQAVDHGLSVTAEFGRLTASAYGYNPFNDSRFWQIAIVCGF